MESSRPQKVVNLLSAILVLLVGFYVIIFLPTGLSAGAKTIIGILLVAYFVVRIKYYSRRYGKKNRRV